MKHSILRKLMLIAVLLTSLYAFAHDFEVNGIYYNITSSTDLTVGVTYQGDEFFDYMEYSGIVEIPKNVTYNNHTYSVTSIGTQAFAGCYELTAITIPSSVTSIQSTSFVNCLLLSSISVESGNMVYDSRGNCNAIIETATNNLVRGCNNTIIPQSVTSIGQYAFWGSLIKSLTIPSSVTSISSNAIGAPILTSIVVENGNVVYDSRDNCNAIIETSTNTLLYGCQNTIIPNSIITIGDNAFFGCENMTSITIPNSVTSIGESSFSNCSGLTSITIPNSVTSIGASAFYYCSGLTSITLGNSLSIIGYNAFNMCSSIAEIKSLNPVAPKLENEPFYSPIYKSAKLSIPVGSLESYQTSNYWKNFTNIVSDLGYIIYADYNSSEGNVTINNEENSYVSVQIDSKVDFAITPNEGYEIEKVTLNGEDVTENVVDGKFSIETVTGDVNFAVTFKLKSFSLLLKCCESGVFKRILNYGETATYEFVPRENWSISTVSFNGADVTNELVDNVYTTPEITEDSELSVVFMDIATSVYSLYDTSDVKVSASHQIIRIKGLQDSTTVVVYDLSGKMEYNNIATDSEMNINMGKDGVYLVKVGERTFKVML